MAPDISLRIDDGLQMRNALALIAGIAAAVAVAVLLGLLLDSSTRETWRLAAGVSVVVFVVWLMMVRQSKGRSRQD